MQKTSPFTMAAILLAALLECNAAWGLPVQLDPSFAGSGVSYPRFPGGDDRAVDSATDEQGRLYILGQGSRESFVARLDPAGNLDATYGSAGIARLAFPEGQYAVSDLNIDSEGRVLIVGNQSPFTNPSVIIRLLPSGVADVSFDNDGYRFVDAAEFGQGLSKLELRAVQRVFVPGRGHRILVAGRSIAGTNFRAAVAAFDDSGARILSFGNNSLYQFPASWDESRFYGLFNDGSALVFAYGRLGVAAGHSRMLLARLDADSGTLDTSVANPGAPEGQRGYVSIDFGSDTESEAHDFDYDNGSRWLLSGSVGLQSTAVARMVPSAAGCANLYPGAFTAGCLDPAFGSPSPGHAAGTQMVGIFSDYFSRSARLAFEWETGPNGLLPRAIYVSGLSDPAGTNAVVARLQLNGQIDPSFGVAGIATYDLGARTRVVDLQARPLNGTPPPLLLIGEAAQANQQGDLAALRVMADGSLDSSFGNGGTRLIDVETRPGSARALHRYTDGRLLLAGGVLRGSASESRQPALLRVLADGGPDPDFGVDGKVVLPLPGSDDNALRAVALDAQGKIYAIATIRHDGALRASLLRLNANGSLDQSFDGDGIVPHLVNSLSSLGEDLVLDGSGRVLITGTRDPLAQDRQGFIARYMPNGSIDSSFATVGTLGYGGLPGSSAFGRRITLDADRIVAAGVDGNSPPRWLIVRLLADGSFDPDFGAQGRAVITPPNALSAQLSALRVDATGRVLFGGSYNESIPFVARLSAGGMLDSSFAGGYGQLGAQITPGEIRAIEIDTPSRVLVAGSAGRNGNPLVLGQDAVIYRLFSNGLPDLQFNLSGRRLIDLGAQSRIDAMSIDAQARINAVGAAYDTLAAFRLTMRAASAVQLSIAPNPSSFGQSINLVVSVGGSPDGDSAPVTGSVQIRRNGVTVADGTLNALGQASLTLADLPPGASPLSAHYVGDAVYAAADSAPQTQQVNRASTSVTLVSLSPANVAYGTALQFRADISAAFGTLPTGEISLRDNQVEISRQMLSAGSATFSISNLLPGSHPLTAVYLGDSGHLPSSASNTITQAVSPAIASGQLVATPNPVTVGQTLTLSSTWTGPIGAASGTLSFRADGNTIANCGAVALVAGAASCTTSFASLGARQLTAQYSGNSSYLAGAVGPLTVQVQANSLFANGFE